MSKRYYGPRADSVSVKKRKITKKTSKKKILLGPKLKATLRYIETVDLNSGVAGIPATYVFSANGCFDPNITGIGHQPRGFDQLMALYDHFIVRSSKITIKWSSVPGNTRGSVVGVMLQDDATPEANMTQAMESRSNHYTHANPGQECKDSILYFNSKEFFTMGTDEILRGTISSNPSEQAYYVLFAQPVDSSTDVGSVNCTVKIEYDVEFIEPNNVAAS